MEQEFPEPDEIFQERYRIVSVIDRGGFARVYLAKQIELDRDVAIKVLQPVRRSGVDESEEAKRLEVIAKRFTREAHLVSQLRDNHTVTMHDYGTTDDGLLYMVLEYINGEALSDLIEEQGALGAKRVVKITRQVLSSLEEAHALGMLHRDIKPANVMLYDHAGRVDRVKVLDFGLAKSVESREFTADDPDLTGDEVILGTPRYMSPEQIRGESLDARTDIYSLGLVIFEMLTGYKAVEGDSTMQTLARHLNEVPIRLPETLAIPGELRRIVNKMLEKSIEDRFHTARDVLDALEDWRKETGPAPELDTDSEPFQVGDFTGDASRRRNMLIGIGSVMGLFLLIAVISALTGNDPDAVAETDDGERAEATETTGTPDEPSEESVIAEVQTDEPSDDRLDESSDAPGSAEDTAPDPPDPFDEAGVQMDDPSPDTEGSEENLEEEMVIEAPEDPEPDEEPHAEPSDPDPKPERVDRPRPSRDDSDEESESNDDPKKKLKLRVLQ